MTPKAGRLAAKTAFSPNYFHCCKPVLSGPRAIFPCLYKGFVAVGRGFSEPAFCTSGLNMCFQRHVMMPINAFVYHLSFCIHHSPSRHSGGLRAGRRCSKGESRWIKVNQGESSQKKEKIL
jgi:hypothetical protein